LSNTVQTLLAILTLLFHILGNEAFITTSGYIGSALLKSTHSRERPL
jgi:hypothetical protein